MPASFTPRDRHGDEDRERDSLAHRDQGDRRAEGPPPPVDIEVPPPEFKAPAPPFVPPPEVHIAAPPPVQNTITAVTQTPPPAPVVIAPLPPPVEAPPAVAPPPAIPAPVAKAIAPVSAAVVCLEPRHRDG